MVSNLTSVCHEQIVLGLLEPLLHASGYIHALSRYDALRNRTDSSPIPWHCATKARTGGLGVVTSRYNGAFPTACIARCNHYNYPSAVSALEYLPVANFINILCRTLLKEILKIHTRTTRNLALYWALFFLP